MNRWQGEFNREARIGWHITLLMESEQWTNRWVRHQHAMGAHTL